MLSQIYITYQIVKRLVLPFNRWKAHELGVIDSHGKVLKKRKNMTVEEKESLGPLDVLVLRIKKIVALAPGGESMLAGALTSFLLVKEDASGDDALDSLSEDSPTNSIGSGQIAGAGQGPQGEPAAGQGVFVSNKFKRFRKASKKTP